jgi:hypothetical protein
VPTIHRLRRVLCQRRPIPVVVSSRLALGSFATALAVLLVNDWLLKGHGLLPGWLTGKLSDVAGLIVAPVSVASAVAARRKRTQLCCIVAVAAIYVLTEISAAGAQLLERWLAWFGLPWRLWPDPSDLAALAVLPLSWFCCRALSSSSGVRSSAGRVARWLTLPACAACLASGGTYTDTFGARAYFYNGTPDTTFVEVSDSWLDCEALSTFGHDVLEPSDFVSLGSFKLAPGEVLPLEPGALGDRVTARSRSDCGCPLLRVTAAGRTVNVDPQDLEYVALVKKPSPGDLAKYQEQLLALHSDSDALELGALLGSFELSVPGAPSNGVTCPSTPPPLDFSFPPDGSAHRTGSDTTAALDDRLIRTAKPVAGNCFELELAAAGAVSEPVPADAGADAGERPPSERFGDARLQICAPFELFPFRAGDRVYIEWIQRNASAPTFESVTLHSSRARFRVARGLYGGLHDSVWQDYETRLPAVRCGPARNPKGVPVEPVDVAYAGQRLVPGSATRIADTNQQIYLGRAWRDLGRSCGADPSWIEVVETWTD